MPYVPALKSILHHSIQILILLVIMYMEEAKICVVVLSNLQTSKVYGCTLTSRYCMTAAPVCNEDNVINNIE